MIIDYMKTPLYRMTFRNSRIRVWVEKQCVGRVLNLFAGETELAANELRNDIRPDTTAHYHMDAVDFITEWSGEKFDTVVLDPPYSYRKSMEMYDGASCSRFNLLKNRLCRVLKKGARVITFGYHSVSMGQKRGFAQERALLMSHGGAIHDTIAVVEVWKGSE